MYSVARPGYPETATSALQSECTLLLDQGTQKLLPQPCSLSVLCCSTRVPRNCYLSPAVCVYSVARPGYPETATSALQSECTLLLDQGTQKLLPQPCSLSVLCCSTRVPRNCYLSPAVCVYSVARPGYPETATSALQSECTLLLDQVFGQSACIGRRISVRFPWV